MPWEERNYDRPWYLVPQSEYIILIYKKLSINFSYSSKMNGMLDFYNKSLLKFLIIHNN